MRFNPRLRRILAAIKRGGDRRTRHTKPFITTFAAVKSSNFNVRVALFGNRSEMPCHYCGVVLAFAAATVDHKIPRSRGGKTDTDNCVVACGNCNGRKANSSYEAFISLLKDESENSLVANTRPNLQK